jgi:predicted amidophosphoribosyltransferase
LASVDLGEYLCDECEAKVSRIMPPFCAKCSEPFDGAITTTFACANCAHRVLYFDAAVRLTAVVESIIRRRRPRGAFRLRKKTDVRNLRVLLIDDVLTTGSTLSECSRVLKEAGARSVYAATAARA